MRACPKEMRAFPKLNISCLWTRMYFTLPLQNHRAVLADDIAPCLVRIAVLIQRRSRIDHWVLDALRLGGVRWKLTLTFLA
jgi:hypothetical protein